MDIAWIKDLTSLPRVAVIILNWNGWEDTLDCLASLERLDYLNYEVVVVDNGSTDGSEIKIRDAYPGITVLRTGENLGFASGNNAGIRYALEKGADHVWLLNNDTVVDPKALSHLVDEVVSDASVGMVGSKIYYYHPPDLIWFAGGTVNKLTGRTRHIGFNEKDSGLWETPRDVDYVSGCSMLVGRSVIGSVGLMDEMFFMYFEDLDWCTRAKRGGWRVKYQPGSLVWHKISKSSKLRSPTMRFQFSRSSIRYAKKHGSPSLLALSGQVFLRQTVSALVRGNLRAAVASIRGAWAGWADV